MSSWQVILIEPAKTVLSQIGTFLSNLLLVIIILIIGWVVAKLIKALVVKVLRSLKFDDLSEKVKLDGILAKGGIKYSLSELIGVICYWLALLVTFVVAINAIGLTIAADLLNRIVLYVPNIIAAIFILILGMFVSVLLSNIVQTAASNAGLFQAKFLGKVAEIVVIVFAVAITMEQLGIGAKIIELVISIIVASLGLSFALAFGLGCKDMAARFLADFIEKLKTKK